MMAFEDSRLPARFWSKVHPCPMSGCWLWTASGQRGYGQFMTGSKRDGSHRPQLAHRISYMALVGPIVDGLHIDHLCRVRSCVNPSHLEPVTRAENTRRGEAGIVNARKTHCPRGHEYTHSNTFLIPNRFRGGVSRACRACRTRRMKERAI